MLNNRVYVLSDHKVLTKYLTKNVKCFHLRDVVKEGKTYVVASREKVVLEKVKDKRDDYYITTISSNTLESYCNIHNIHLLYIDNCHKNECDVSYFGAGGGGG